MKNHESKNARKAILSEVIRPRSIRAISHAGKSDAFASATSIYQAYASQGFYLPGVLFVTSRRFYESRLEIRPDEDTARAANKILFTRKKNSVRKYDCELLVFVGNRCIRPYRLLSTPSYFHVCFIRCKMEDMRFQSESTTKL